VKKNETAVSKPSLEQIKRNYCGMISDEQIDRLHYLASQVPDNGLILEIGPHKGRSTSAIASGMRPSVHLITIDPHMLSKDMGKGYNADLYSSVETVNEFLNNISPWHQQITYIMAWPLVIEKYLKEDQFIDMIFLDCVKDYPTISATWLALLPRCRGIVASHDADFEGVARVIEEIIKPQTTDHLFTQCLFDARIKRDEACQ